MVSKSLETVGKVNNYLSMFIIVLLIVSNIIAIFGTIASGVKRTSTATFILKSKTQKVVTGSFVHNGTNIPVTFSQNIEPTTIYYDPSNPTNYAQYKTTSIVGGLIFILLILILAYYALNRCSNSEFCNQIVGARSVYKMVTH